MEGENARVWVEGVITPSKYLSDPNSGKSNDKYNYSKNMAKRTAQGGNYPDVMVVADGVGTKSGMLTTASVGVFKEEGGGGVEVRRQRNYIGITIGIRLWININIKIRIRLQQIFLQLFFQILVVVVVVLSDNY